MIEPYANRGDMGLSIPVRIRENLGKEKLSCIYFSLLVSAILEDFFRGRFNVTILLINLFFFFYKSIHLKCIFVKQYFWFCRIFFLSAIFSNIFFYFKIYKFKVSFPRLYKMNIIKVFLNCSTENIYLDSKKKTNLNT